MALKHIDLEAALRRLADKRIEDAIADGKFDNLPGKGQPLDLEPMPAEENARMTWWMLRILSGNNFTPEEVVWRKAIDHLRERLEKLTDESRLAHMVDQINELVFKINTLGTNTLNTAVCPVDLETERQRLRERISRGNGQS